MNKMKQKTTEEKGRKKPFSLVQKNPKLAALVIIVVYFMMDYLMMGTNHAVSTVLVVIGALLAPSTLYSYYVSDYNRGIRPRGGTDVPEFIKNKNRYVTIGWLVFLIWGIILLAAGPAIVSRFFPVLNQTYYRSQIVLITYMAPIMEELIFRYLLYDRWLKRKCGWFGGFIIASLIFVFVHPVTNMHSFVIYWIPTVLFFLIYREFGLYGSIMIHMIYNMIAI